MALWGTADSIYSTGNVTAITSSGVITGSGTTFVNSGLVQAGQVITMGTYGSGVIKSVDSNTQLTLVSASGLSGVSTSGITQSFNINQAPKYTTLDSNWSGNEIYGSDPNEVGIARTTIYAHAHAGWVGIATYTDMHGNVRTKTEVLVAMSSIERDAADDSVLAD